MISRDDLHAFASLVAYLGKNEPEIGRVALAFALRNRFDGLGDEDPGALARFCRSVVSPTTCDGSDKGWHGGEFADPEFRHALAICCQVWNEELADPTAGATHFHRHDELPDWARHLEPAALLGSHFFYILPCRHAARESLTA